MFGGGYVPGADMDSFLDTYGTDAVVHPIVARLAESTSEAEWGLFADGPGGEIEDRTAIKSHAVLDLIEHPNDFQTFGEIVESGQQHFDLVGETSIVLGIEGGLKYPLDMWVLRPDRIQPVPDPDTFLKGWIYRAPGSGELLPIETREMLRMRQPNPKDPYRGMGAIQALMRDLDTQRYTKEWQAAFFQNSARPGGIIEVPEFLGDAQFEEMRDHWEQQHKGGSKAHRVAILEHGVWKDTAFSLRDLQMAELEQIGRDKALIAFGFPKSMLGIVEDVNRANAEAGEYVFARWLIRPRLTRWRSMLNRQLLPMFVAGGRVQDVRRARLVLDFVDPVPENSEQAINELKVKSEVVVALTAAGYDSAEVLELVSWPELTYEKPAPPPVVVPSKLGGAKPALPAKDDTVDDEERELIFASLGVLDRPGVDLAMRWKVTGHPDTSCCDPCMKNLGKLYRNRQSAYADYPGGKSYIKCVGEQYGNHCRCRVIKRNED